MSAAVMNAANIPAATHLSLRIEGTLRLSTEAKANEAFCFTSPR
jgi:hypothetical protein